MTHLVGGTSHWTPDTVVPQTFEWLDGFDSGAVERLLRDDRWVAEQKLDGMRCMVKVHAWHDGCEVDFFSHGGRRLVQAAAVQHFERLRGALETRGSKPTTYLLDGELMADTGELWLFDMMWGGYDDAPPLVKPEDPWVHRRQSLKALVDLVHSHGPHRHLPLEQQPVRMVPVARGTEAKADLLQAVMDTHTEGVCFKDSEASYDADGNRVRTVLKLKVKHSVDCVVTARNVGTAENVRGETVQVKNAHLAVYRDANSVVPDVALGSCSMNGKPDAQVGDVVEVRYLSWKQGGHLVQPDLQRIRDDKAPHECLLGQLVPSNKHVLEVLGT